MAFYLAIKEIWHGKGRFLLFSLVIALITILVLFIAGLAEGLADANREYLAKIDAELLVFQKNTKLSTTASRIGRRTINQIKRVPGVAAIGPIGLSSATLVQNGAAEDLDIALIGVEPGKPGGAEALQGKNLRSRLAYEAVIDANVAAQTGLQVGDELTIKSIQGTDEEFYDLEVIGISDGRQYFFQPAIFVPADIWDRIRPQAQVGEFDGSVTYNIVAVRLQNPAEQETMRQRLESMVDDVEVSDKVTAYESSPGYQAQQSTLNTQRGFTLLIGILVIGGFFQIQTLQKVPNIGMLKAVGASNAAVGLSVVIQILAVTVVGVLLGSLGVYLLALAFPAGVPIRFTGDAVMAAVLSLIIIGPVGGLVSVRLALRVEPLMALGLSN